MSTYIMYTKLYLLRIILDFANFVFADKVYFTGLRIYDHNSPNFTYIRTTITSLYRGDMWFDHVQK